MIQHYNRPIILKENDVNDRLMRQDHLYDVIVEIDHNTRPRIAGRGSAVFIHLTRDAFWPHRWLRWLRDEAICCGWSRGLSAETRIVIRMM